jgi:hypothetical protein
MNKWGTLKDGLALDLRKQSVDGCTYGHGIGHFLPFHFMMVNKNRQVPYPHYQRDINYVLLIKL